MARTSRPGKDLALTWSKGAAGILDSAPMQNLSMSKDPKKSQRISKKALPEANTRDPSSHRAACTSKAFSDIFLERRSCGSSGVCQVTELH